MANRFRFTLRDMLLVITVLTVVTAFAVPAWLRSRLRSTEAGSIAGLKQLVSTESTWRQVDADGNGVQDYWTLDVAGFYGMEDASRQIMKFIDVNFAKADGSRRVSYSGQPSPNSAPCSPVPKRGYVFRAMISDDGEGRPRPYSVNYVPTAPLWGRPRTASTILRNRRGAYGCATATNSYLFGFCAMPTPYQAPLRTFIVNEEGVIYGVDRGCNAFVATWPGTDPTAKTNKGRFWSVVQ